MERTEVSDNFDLTIEAQEGIKKIFQQIFNVFEAQEGIKKIFQQIFNVFKFTRKRN